MEHHKVVPEIKHQITARDLNDNDSRHLVKRGIYVNHYNKIPNLLVFTHISPKKWELYATQLEHKAKKYYFKKAIRERKRKLLREEDYFLLEEDLLIDYCSESKKVGLMWNETSSEIIENYTTEVLKLRSFKKPKNSIKLINLDAWGLNTIDFKIDKNDAQLKDLYNDDFLPVHDLIYQRLNSKNNKGIVLLHGLPGTGKTSYVKQLVTTLNKSVVFLPPHMASALDNPKFLKLLMQNKNAIFVIEDAEKILIDRNDNQNSPVSTILNMSDGILSEILHIQIICSFNTDLTKVDKALLRKGRLIAKYEFGKLETAKANLLSEKLGFKTTFTEPQVLTDIYNQEEMATSMPLRKAIGFN